MKVKFIVHSWHHNNTLKVAKEMGTVVESSISSIKEIKVDELSNYELIGFGAGIDSGKHYKELLEFAKTLPVVENKKCFIFSTAGVYTYKKMIRDHKALNQILTEKGYQNIGDFSCLGFNTNVFLKYIGGINKTRPNQEDYNNAKDFIKSLVNA
ncbi:hypothetical protein CI105_08225 [Candidatus Izimaplasma bacterium ZiA1]|uniref:flavodoxin family protein n=1 Tax=Candidatus Izimoplasma sp. ZiA1 TaxID=2024899 RepID=UPI000BAA65DC|nr:hypothetical protein CI105_08225 [Candidatus Izimaplasma bacterium ZiA1]